MGIKTIETLFVYLFVPYCLYLVYRYKYPEIRDCSFCETDSWFHRCKPMTGKTSKFCYNFTNADSYLKELFYKIAELSKNILQFIFYNIIFMKDNLGTFATDIISELSSLTDFGITAALSKLDFSCKVGKVDPCKRIKNSLNEAMDGISEAIRVAWRKLFNTIKNNVVQPIIKILDTVKDSIFELFDVVTEVFSDLTGLLGKIIDPLSEILIDVVEMIKPRSLRYLIYSLLGVIVVGTLLPIVLGVLLSSFSVSIPLGGLIGFFKFIIYLTLFCINQIYHLFDIDIRESPIIILIENII